MIVIADTGPLVALFNEKDQWHLWASRTSKQISRPIIICEAVITEIFFLLGNSPKSKKRFIEALERPGVFTLPWSFERDRDTIMNLYSKYRDIPASFADMCILQIASTMKSPLVWTIDHHFQIYRLPGNKAVPTVSLE